MSLFDTVWLECPKCTAEVPFQSKTGLCVLDSYHPPKIPPEVAAGVLGKVTACSGCQAKVRAVGIVMLQAVLEDGQKN